MPWLYISIMVVVGIFALLGYIVLKGGKKSNDDTSMLNMTRKMPFFLDLVNGEFGSFINKENTEDNRFVNVFYVPLNSLRAVKIDNVPKGSLIYDNSVTRDGAVAWTEDQYGEAPFLNSLKLNLKSNIKKLHDNLEEERSRSASHQIRSRRAISGLQTGLRDYREMNKILGETRGSGGEDQPWLRHNRFERGFE